jgi:hypothetical protein
MVGITAGAFGQLMYDEPLGTVLLGLLGDNYWGEQALVGEGGGGCCPGAGYCVGGDFGC